MIPTVPQDVFISLMQGHLFALTAAADIRSGDAVRDRKAFLRATAFAVGVFWPIGVYLMTVYPAWSWMYFVDPTAHPRWVGYAATLAYPISGVAGYALARAFIRAGRTSAAVAGCVASAAGFLSLVFVPWHRFIYVGTFAEWAAGVAAPLLSDWRWIRDMVIIGTVFNVAALTVVVYNRRGRLRGARADAHP